ncbi:hypothetical protein ACW2Q0_28280 [Nocardia sp. R16R-3T]
MVDTGVYMVARALVDRLAVELVETRAGAACIAIVHPGNTVPSYGWCGCDAGEGMAWSRVVSVAPTERFPIPLASPPTPGRTAQLVAVIELGVDRCYWSTEDNSMPDPAFLDSMARDVIDDAAAMRAAVAAVLTADDADQVIVGQWLPRGPQGGIHGGTLTVTVCVDTCGPGSSMPPLDEVIPMMDGDPRAQAPTP